MSAIDRKLFEGKKIIVTGGAGFIGSHICEELVPLGAEVFCLDNMSAGKAANVEALRSNRNFHLVVKDICDRDDDMAALFRGTDIVFNNAASKKTVCLINPLRDLEVNGAGTLNLLLHSVEHGVAKFVHASTGSVYGEPKIFPTDENHPLEPTSYYGVSKLAGDRYVDVFHRLHGLNTTILRYFHVYGPRQESNDFGGVVSIFARRILANQNPVVFGTGDQIRSFTWVKDLVQANLAAAVLPSARGQSYNIASGIQVTIGELATRMLEILDKSRKLQIDYGPPTIGDVLNFDVDNRKASKHLGVEFHQDFWSTLREALSDVGGFFGGAATR